MSLAGKILAVLNLLGAIGLAYLASQDYATRQTWAHEVFRAGLLINGLPVEKTELGEDGEPIYPRLNGGGKDSPLANLGPALDPLTQEAEVERVKRELDAKIDAAGQDPVEQTRLLARILLPLTDAPHEREQLLACRLNLQTQKEVAELRARMQNAFKEALQQGPANLPEKPFSLAFRDAMRRQEVKAKNAEPADTFVSMFLRKVPDDRAKAKGVNFDQVWTETISAQVEMLKARYDRLFNEARGEPGENVKTGQEGRRAAIARLLFGLAPFQAEESILGDAGKQQEQAQLNAAAVNFVSYQLTLLSTPTYDATLKRATAVCGLRAMVGAISERALAVRRIGDYVQQAMTQERQQFVYDNLSVIEQLREQANLVRGEQSVINENKDRLAGYDTVVKERQKEIEALKGDFEKMRADNAQRAGKLRDLTQQVLDLRVRIRDAIAANEQGERRLRELERQASGGGKGLEKASNAGNGK